MLDGGQDRAAEHRAAYNEFIVALTFLGQAQSDYTLPIYVTYFFGKGGADWGPIMAASAMYTIPVIIFFMLVRRRLVGGLVAAAVKGRPGRLMPTQVWAG